MEERIILLKALRNLIKRLVDQGIMYVLLIAGLCLLLYSRNDKNRQDRVYRAIAILLMGLGLGLLGTRLAGIRRNAQ